MQPIMQVDRKQIDAALKRKEVFAEIMLINKACYINGLIRLQNFLLQKTPTSDGLPFLLLPCSEEMISLFSFMVRCRTEDYKCEDCFWKNECVRKTLERIEFSVRRANKREIPIDELLMNGENYKQKDDVQAAIELLKKIIYKLGEERIADGAGVEV